MKTEDTGGTDSKKKDTDASHRHVASWPLITAIQVIEGTGDRPIGASEHEALALCGRIGSPEAGWWATFWSLGSVM